MDIHKLYHLVFRASGFRRRRMQLFAQLLAPSESTAIADVGGTLHNWEYLDVQPQVTLLNLDVSHKMHDYPPHVRFQRADALNLPFGDNCFDIAFSNSVIEHVSTWTNQQRFALEVRRIAPRIWVQTPALEFFLEPHLLTPFIHWLPRKIRRRLLRHFTVWGWMTRPSRVQVERFLEEVRLLRRAEMEALFPDCTVFAEKFMGLPKSYVAYRV